MTFKLAHFVYLFLLQQKVHYVSRLNFTDTRRIRHFITRCIKHHSIPGSVGEEYFLNEAYLVDKGEKTKDILTVA